MQKFALRTTAAVFGAKAIWDMGHTGYEVGSHGFKQRDPLVLTMTPIIYNVIICYNL